MKPSIGKITSGLGYALYNVSKSLMKFGLSMKYYTMSYTEVDKLVKEQINCNSWFWDSKFWFTDLEIWKNVIARDELNEYRKWRKERFDCDNFSAVFKSHVSEIFDMNGVGICLGAVLDKNTKEVKGYHAYNCLIAKNEDKTELYLYEPQNDYLARAQRETDMGWAIYRTDMILWW